MPAPALVTTPKATNANSYCTLVEANAYYDARIAHAAWGAAGTTDDMKNKALLMACRLLDALYEWNGFPTTTDQALQWPRNAVMDLHEWEEIDVDTIPTRLKEIQAEFAGHLLTDDRTLDFDVERYGITSLSAGPVSLAFRDGVSAKTKVVPDAVKLMVPSWWGRLRTLNRGSVPVVRT